MPENSSDLEFRRALIEDLPSIISLLFDDALGAQRENLDEAAVVRYEAAFRAIEAQQGNQILLGVQDGEVIAMLQLTIIPGLSHQGGTRAQIESVRVKSSVRAQGVGKKLFCAAIAMSREAGCCLVQLTTDLRRPDAKRFYENLGFKPSHVGMKLVF